MTTRLGVVLCLVVATAALGTDCPTAAGVQQGVGARSGEERLTWLAARFSGEADAVDRWTLVWGGGYGVLTVAQLGLMGAFPRGDQPDWYWGAVSAAVGVIFAVIPLEATTQAPSFRARAAAAGPEQVCALVAEGERLLAEGAAQESFGTQWFVHVANVLFNGAFSLLYWLGYGHVQTALINGVAGTALGEGTIFTQPTGLVSGWDEYRSGPVRQALQWTLFPAGLGLGFALRF